MTAPAPVTFEAYVARQAVIVAALVRVLVALLLPFRPVGLTADVWRVLVATLYPHIAHARTRSAELAREFYDTERALRRPGLPRQPVDLPGYAPDWLNESLAPYREAFSRPDASVNDLARIVSLGAKHAEDAGRKTVLRAVETDREVIGWARVEGEKETCAFCLMLISRGAVYLNASTAGLDTDDTTAEAVAEDFIRTGDTAFMDALMTRWHPDCDCKVIPVFDRDDWPRRARFLAAQDLWASATKGHSGKDALNALRRALYAGERDDELPAALRIAA